MKNFFMALAALMVMLGGASLALAQDDYRIKPGDVLRVEVLEDATLNRSVLVLPDGSVSLPLAGSLTVGGRTLSQVSAELLGKLSPNFAAPPSLFVGVEKLAEPRAAGNGTKAAAPVISVYIIGESAKPGRYEVKPGSTLLQVLAESGGFSKFAATKRVQLRRGDQVYTYNYQALEQGAVTANPIKMSNGDVIIIPQRRLFE